MISEQEALWHCTPKAQWQGPPGLWVLSDVRQLPNHSGPRFPFRKTISLLIPTPVWLDDGERKCVLQTTEHCPDSTGLCPGLQIPWGRGRSSTVSPATTTGQNNRKSSCVSPEGHPHRSMTK